jgi:2-oxoglutarate ferredoxin oxidoreductase subunit beta
VEIFQNCNIFNDKAFDNFTERSVRDEANILLEHGKAIRFGPEAAKGLRWGGTRFETVEVFGDDSGLVVHDIHDPNPTLAFALSRLTPPRDPMPLGVFRQIEKPTLDGSIHEQLASLVAKRGTGDLHDLLHAGDTWTVGG